MLKGLLGFACIVEIATAVAAIVAPQAVVALLLGEDVSGVGVAVARCFGVALLALGLACWPIAAQTRGPALRAMLVYNAAIALYLAHIFAFRHVGGVLLWPAVALHAAVAALLVAAWRRSKATG